MQWKRGHRGGDDAREERTREEQMQRRSERNRRRQHREEQMQQEEATQGRDDTEESHTQEESKQKSSRHRRRYGLCEIGLWIMYFKKKGYMRIRCAGLGLGQAELKKSVSMWYSTRLKLFVPPRLGDKGACLIERSSPEQQQGASSATRCTSRLGAPSTTMGRCYDDYNGSL